MQPQRFTAALIFPELSRPEDFKYMVFDLKKLVTEWHRTPEICIYATDLSPTKRHDFEMRYARREAVPVPIVRYTQGMTEGSDIIDILDGRHRTAFLHHKGLPMLPAAVHTHDVDLMIQRGMARLATPCEVRAIEHNLPFPGALPESAKRKHARISTSAASPDYREY
jgi:hypothetical protein